jgi:hypothetical protein
MNRMTRSERKGGRWLKQEARAVFAKLAGCFLGRSLDNPAMAGKLEPVMQVSDYGSGSISFFTAKSCGS